MKEKIPEGWKECQLGKELKYIKGKKPSRLYDEPETGRDKYLIVDSLTDNGTKYADSSEGVLCNKDDVLVIGDGSRSGYVFTGFKGLVSSTFMKVEPKNNDLNKKYLYYLMLNLDLTKDKYRKGGAIPHFDYKALKVLNYPIPPLPEQNKIAEILTTVDEAIGETEKLITTLRDVFSSSMKKILLEGLPSYNHKYKDVKVKYSPLVWKIPEEWELTDLSHLTKKITDGTHKTPKYLEEGMPFLRVTDIQKSKINWENVKHISIEEHEELCRRCKPEKGDILLSKNGTIGIPYLINFDKEFSIFVSLCLIKPKPDIDAEYLLYVLKSEIVFLQYHLRSKKGTVTNLHLEEIRELQIPFPSAKEQKEIVTFFKSMEGRIIFEEEKLRKLQTLKQGLMQKLLTGKLRVKV